MFWSFLALSSCGALADVGLLDNSWYLYNEGQYYGIPGEDINYKALYDSVKGRYKYTGNGIRIVVMGDGADYDHKVYGTTRSMETQFRELWKDNEEREVPKKFEATTAQKVLGLIGGSHGNECQFDGVAPGAQLGSYRFHEPSITGRNESLQYVVCHNKKEWDIAVVLWRDWDCDHDAQGFHCKLISAKDTPHNILDDCLYNFVGSSENPRPSLFVVPAGVDNKISDTFQTPTNRWPLMFVISAVSNRGLPLSDAAEGPGIFMACPGYKAAPDSTGSVINFAAPGNRCNVNGETFEYSNASAAIFAGGLAIVLEANPKLTLADLYYIFAMTATKVHPDSALWTKHRWNPDSDTDTYGLWYNRRCGFGRMDLGKAVALAESWKNSGYSVGHFKSVKLFDATYWRMDPNSEGENDIIPTLRFQVKKEDLKINEAYILDMFIEIDGVDLKLESLDIILIVRPDTDTEEMIQVMPGQELIDQYNQVAHLEFSCREFLGVNLFDAFEIRVNFIDWTVKGAITNVSITYYYTEKRPDTDKKAEQATGNDEYKGVGNDNDRNLNKNIVKFTDTKVKWVAGSTDFSAKLDLTAASDEQAKCSYVAWLDQKDVTVTGEYQWNGMHLDATHMKLKTDKMQGKDKPQFTLPYIPSLYKNGVENLYLRIESLDPACGGWYAEVPIEYEQPYPDGKVTVHPYGKYDDESAYPFSIDTSTEEEGVQLFEISLEDWQKYSGISVTRHRSWDYIIEEGYIHRATLSLSAIVTYVIARKRLTGILGYGDLNVEVDGVRASDRVYYIDFGPASGMSMATNVTKIEFVKVHVYASKAPKYFISSLTTAKNVGMVMAFGIAMVLFFVRLVMVWRSSRRQKAIDAERKAAEALRDDAEEDGLPLQDL